MTVRTRVAPSPTGDPHVGTAYVALFNYCYAKRHGGQFVLRIEDTDRARSTAASERAIIDALRWVGLDWDEGPDVGGTHGPYRQSERGDIYAAHAEQLLESGKAFRCFCTRERLSELRAAQLKAGGALGYDGLCAELPADQAKARADAGESHVVRLLVPRQGTCVVQDMLRGEIHIDWATVDMQVLLKSDGMPTYHLANVVDDHDMRITHVARGEEWINSAPKHLLLYEAFGWEAPVLCHLPLLRNPDKSKLSKRKNPTSILWYQRMGYLPEALLNYLGMMAWTMPGGQDRFTLDEMVAAFDLADISLGGPVFDLQKLDWLSGRWIREALTDVEFGERVVEWALNPAYLGEIGRLARHRVTRLTELAPLTGFFFEGSLGLEADAFDKIKLEQDVLRQAFYYAAAQFTALPTWDRDGVEQVLRGLADHFEQKPRDFLPAFYVAVTGAASSVPLFDAAALLGRDMTRARVTDALGLLGTPSKKERKRWDRTLHELQTQPAR